MNYFNIKDPFERGRLVNQKMKEYEIDPAEFGREQLERIEDGILAGLSKDQIAMFADPKYGAWQMREIQDGLEDGLSMEQVKTYADPAYGSGQMCQIREGFNNGLSTEQVKTYADLEFDFYQMAQIRQGLEHGLSMEQAGMYADPKNSWWQMRKMREYFEHGNKHPLNAVPEERIMRWADPGFASAALENMLKGYETVARVSLLSSDGKNELAALSGAKNIGEETRIMARHLLAVNEAASPARSKFYGHRITVMKRALEIDPKEEIKEVLEAMDEADRLSQEASYDGGLWPAADLAKQYLDRAEKRAEKALGMSADEYAARTVLEWAPPHRFKTKERDFKE